MNGKIKAALLVDADNLPIAQAEEALVKLAGICNPVIKKAFGDFTKSAKNWSPEFMRKHGFTPEMHYAVSNFKNGADIAMCIAAMDIIYAKSVDAIVLFTSDSDFASLAARIREAGLEVVGVGDAKASEILQGAFDTFVVVEAAMPPPKPEVKPVVKQVAPKAVIKPAPAAVKSKAEVLNEASKALQNIVKTPAKKTTVKAASKQKLVPAPIRKAIVKEVQAAINEGVSPMVSRINAKMQVRLPGFTYKMYGYSKMSLLLNSMSEVVLIDGNKAVRLSAGQKSK